MSGMKITGLSIAQASELIRKNLTLLSGGMSVAEMFETHESRRIRMQIGQTHRHGQAMGLTEGQVQEVIKAWELYYRSTPFPVDWVAVRESLARRARGEEWKP